MSTEVGKLPLLNFEDDVPVKDGKLYPAEIFWAKHQAWLKESGYLLRPRYQPDWVASWIKDTSKFWATCEDSIALPVRNLMDATRASDGTPVMLKRIDPARYGEEISIGQLFLTKPLADDSRNHCCPILEVLQVPEDDTSIIVMPFLQRFNKIPFDTVGEFVEFFRQITEGLQLMHENDIAHCDCKINNIMMDASPLYRLQPHPIYLGHARDDFTKSTKPTTRTLHPVKYYLIDFGLSQQYDSSTPQNLRLKQPRFGGDRTVPEFKIGEPCNPFRVDVYCLGNVVREWFLKGSDISKPKLGLEFMADLINDMVHDDPSSRPTMTEVVERFTVIRSRLSSLKRRSRVAPVNETFKEKTFNSIAHWARQFSLICKRIPSIPTPK